VKQYECDHTQNIIITATIILNLNKPKILAPANYWCTQNIGGGKIYENIGAGKYTKI
jgi:hypothetical protein